MVNLEKIKERELRKLEILKGDKYSYLLNKFNIGIEDLFLFLIKFDNLNLKELEDLEYIEERIEIHLEE